MIILTSGYSSTGVVHEVGPQRLGASKPQHARSIQHQHCSALPVAVRWFLILTQRDHAASIVCSPGVRKPPDVSWASLEAAVLVLKALAGPESGAARTIAMDLLVSYLGRLGGYRTTWTEKAPRRRLNKGFGGGRASWRRR